MSDNWLFAINIIMRTVSGTVIVGLGVYLLLHGHLTGGGWTILGGLMIAHISYSDKEEIND